jgi:UDP-N-acetyl-D-galactosamine dehydrogenase
MLGYHPQVILAGRRINDGMGKFIAEQTIKQMIASGSYIKGARSTCWA